MGLPQALAGGGEQLRAAALCRLLAHAGQRRGVGVGTREGHRAGQQIAVYQFVDQAQRLGLLGPDRVTRQHHLQRLLRAHHARQSLRSTRARQHAQFHFRQPQLRPRHRHPVGAGQRQFQSATQRRAVNGRHYGLAKAVQPVHRAAQIGRLLARQVEGADVCARHEGSSAADDHHSANGLIGLGHVQARVQPLRHAHPKGIHRRVLNGQDQDFAVSGLVDEVLLLRCHVFSSICDGWDL